MKIEIDLEEVESLRKKIQNLQEESESLQKKLNELSEDQLIKKATDLAYRIFQDYMYAVFKHLGFEHTNENPVRIDNNFRKQLGKHWFESERIKVVLGVNITNKFKEAFMIMGIKTQSIEPSETDNYTLEDI
jgi:hypothetical protein